MGPFGAMASSRDMKSRRRENPVRQPTQQEWDNKIPGGGKRDKEDFIDQNLVDYLRKGEGLVRWFV